MELANRAIAIMAVAIVLYRIPKIPVWITSCFTMIAMVWAGCIDYATAYSGFCNRVIFLIAGMSIMSQACVTTGLAERISNKFSVLVGPSEKRAVLFVLLFGGVMSIFLNGSLVVSVLMPMLDCMVTQSDGTITRKRTYFPLGIVATMGNALTSFSATSTIACIGMLTAAGYREIGLFEPIMITGPAFVVFILFYMTAGYELSKKWFDFPDPPVPYSSEKKPSGDEAKMMKKQTITAATVLVVLVSIILGGDMGAWPILGSCVLIITGCIDERGAYAGVSWSTLITVGATIGFSNALIDTGAGELLADYFCSIAGDFGNTPFGMSVILLVIASVLSAFLTDNGSVSCMVPITIGIAAGNGWDPLPLVIAVCCGLKICQFFTPICNSCVTQTLAGGARVIDYLRLGTIISIINGVVIILMIAVVY